MLKNKKEYLLKEITKSFSYGVTTKVSERQVEDNVYEVTFTNRLIKGENEAFKKLEKLDRMIEYFTKQ